MGKGRNTMPDRWDAYTDMGRTIPGTRFIAFKVPLREEILKCDPAIRPDEHFGPRHLTDHCSNLGLVIDLTNTNRYYDRSVFVSQGIKYKKLMTEGHVVPKKKPVYEFMKAVDGFLEENKENDKLIGVHCTHGINRTGYMICRYMIQRLNIPADQAISDFDSARGHKQERENYLQDLREATWINEDPYEESKNNSEDGSNERQQQYGHGDGEYQEEDRPEDNNYRNGYFRRENDVGNNSDYSPLGPSRRWSNSPQRGGRGSPYNRDWRGDYRNGGHRGPRGGRFSPAAAREYYNNHYHGQPSQQYDPHFYHRRDAGEGIGPHRPESRRDIHFRDNGNQIGPHRHRHRYDHEEPRQYRGRRNYRSPPRQQKEDPSIILSPPSNQNKTPALPPMDGPSRNPLSPGAQAGIFSPEGNTTPRIGTATPGLGATPGTPSVKTTPKFPKTPGFAATPGLPNTPGVGTTPSFPKTPGFPKTPDFLSTPRRGGDRNGLDGTPRNDGEGTPRRRPHRWAPY